MAVLRRVNGEAWLVAGAGAALVLVYCLRNGTYDVVARGEMGILIWVALGLGWATGVLPREKPGVLMWPVAAGFLALAVWTAVALGWTESDERTAVEIGRVVHHGGAFLLAASLLSGRTWRAALGGVAVGLAVVAWLGLCNWLWPGSIAVDDTRRVFGVQRLSYPLDYFNGMATLGAMTVVGLLAWATHAPTWWQRAAAAAPIPGAALVTYLTYSRGGALEVAVGLLVLFAFSRHRIPMLIQAVVVAGGSALAILALRDHPELVKGIGDAGSGEVLAYVLGAGALSAVAAWALHAMDADRRLHVPRRFGVPALAAAAVVVLGAAAIAAPSTIERAIDGLGDERVNDTDNPTARFTTLGSLRLPQFQSAIDTWEQSRWEGSGPGTYEFTWNRSPRYQGYVRDAHSLYLEALSETGVPGLAALVVIIAGLALLLVLAAVREQSPSHRGAVAVAAALIAVYLTAAAIDWVWELTALSFIAFAAAGAVAAGAGDGRYRSRLRPSRVLVPVAALIGALAILPPVVSTSEVRNSQAAARDEDPGEALRHAEEAIDIAPWSASAVAQKSLLLEEAGRFAQAEAYARAAEDREPTNWRYPLLRARLLARLGEPAAAVGAFRRARELAPRKAVFAIAP